MRQVDDDHPRSVPESHLLVRACQYRFWINRKGVEHVTVTYPDGHKKSYTTGRSIPEKNLFPYRCTTCGVDRWGIDPRQKADQGPYYYCEICRSFTVAPFPSGDNP